MIGKITGCVQLAVDGEKFTMSKNDLSEGEAIQLCLFGVVKYAHRLGVSIERVCETLRLINEEAVFVLLDSEENDSIGEGK
ncbi:hypothetical protein FAD87_RS09340 [Enterococcus hirae]